MIKYRNPAIILLVVLILISLLFLSCISSESQTTGSTIRAISPWAGNRIVQTRYGAVQGFKDKANTWVWKGIPYAKPPIGQMRWKAPEAPEPWEGVRKMKKFGCSCTQYAVLSKGRIIGNEDCLYLNIWRPRSEEVKLPVYMWIHGGGNSIGSADFVPDYYGTNVAGKSNMVFVSVNYRLGPFGWFTHPALRSAHPGNEESDSGNYGTLDLIQALKWIQENIEAFGGDPDRVTITGESAGGINVLSLMISPPARNLFHRAMSQSGAMRSSRIERGDASSHQVLLKLLLKDNIVLNPDKAEAYAATMSRIKIASYLRSKSADEIFSCYESGLAGMISFPGIFEDGIVIHADGFDSFKNGTYPNKVPIILGSNKDEIKLFLVRDRSLRKNKNFFRTVTAIGSDLWKAREVDETARMLSRHSDQPNVYVYQFCWGAVDDRGKSALPGRWGFKLGAFHTLEIPFFLGTKTLNGRLMSAVLFTGKYRGGREALSDAMMNYAAQFAHTGNPNNPGSDLPEWQPWINETGVPKCMIFDADENHAKLRMSPLELTREGVLARIKSEAGEVLYREAMKYIFLQPLMSSE